MTLYNILGYLLIAMPFVVLFFIISKFSGVRIAVAIFGSILLLVALMYLGVTLIFMQ